MTNTKTKTILKALLSATALTVFATGTAQAQVVDNNFTQAGTEVRNTFTLDYLVGGAVQTQINSLATPTLFTVDRLVDLVVASQGDNTVVPNSVDQQLVFSVSNEGNDTQAYDLSFVDRSDDNFDTTVPASSVPTLVYYADLDGNGEFDPDGLDGSPTTYDPAARPQVAPDEVLWVVVSRDISIDANDTQTASITLVADTYTLAGVEVLADSDGNSLEGDAENVLADGFGTDQEVDNAGDHSATATYLVAAAELTGEKLVTVYSQVSDATACGVFPGNATGGYAIPQSCVEYVISVSNAGSVPATNLVVNDVLPEELTYVNATFGGDFTGGAFTPALQGPLDCAVVDACTVNVTGLTLPAPADPATPTVGTVTIRALVQ